MTQINNLPDKQEALNKMRIIDTLRNRTANINNLFSNSIAIALNSSITPNLSINNLFSFIRESAEDNYKLVAEVIGVELLEQIKKGN